jgi:hypothetical protein
MQYYWKIEVLRYGRWIGVASGYTASRSRAWHAATAKGLLAPEARLVVEPRKELSL